MKTPEEVRTSVEQDFAELESQLEKCGPGVLDVMQLYGHSADLVRAESEYVAMLNRGAVLSNSNTSG